MRTCSPWLALLGLIVGQSNAWGADEAGIEFFEKKVRPILVTHCYECHSAEAKKLGGNLLLDSREGVRKGGDEGPAIKPGQPEKSRLIAAIGYDDDSLQMPPSGKLAAEAIADLEAWVKMGAPDPRDKPTAARPARTWEETLKNRRTWWSLQRVRRPEVPPVKDAHWSSDPVDRFILARLEAKGLTPAPPADPRTLARRLSPGSYRPASDARTGCLVCAGVRGSSK